MSNLETNPRYRINADQGRDNRWSFNATAEDKDIHIRMTNNPEDLANVAHDPIGLKLLSMIKETEEVFRDDGRVLISDGNLQALSPPKSYNKEKATAWFNENIDKVSAQLSALTTHKTAYLLTGKSKTTKKS